MKTDKIIAKYQGADCADFQKGTIYVLKIVRGSWFTTIWLAKPWYKFWGKSGFRQYEGCWFYRNWVVLEQCV